MKTKTVGEKDIQSFARLLAGVSNPQAMRRILDEILTPSELHDLALRWRLLQHLYAGESQRHIAGALGISLCKITRGSRILKRDKGELRKLLDALPPTSLEKIQEEVS